MLECLRIKFLDTHVKFTQPQIRLSACTSFMLRGSASRLRHRPKQMGYMKAHSAWIKITVSCIAASTHNENANDNNGRLGFSRNVTSANQQRALISTCFIPVHVLRCSLPLSRACAHPRVNTEAVHTAHCCLCLVCLRQRGTPRRALHCSLTAERNFVRTTDPLIKSNGTTET